MAFDFTDIDYAFHAKPSQDSKPASTPDVPAMPDEFHRKLCTRSKTTTIIIIGIHTYAK
jgi:hypothetical protein